MDISQLLQSVKTVEDRNRLYSEIEVVSAAIYKEGELAKVLDEETSKILRDYVGNNSSREILSKRPTRLASESVAGRLSDLKKSMDELVVIRLTLAFEPAESTIEKLVGFIRHNLEGKAILEFPYDPAILGGVILEYKGLYRDYSLKTKIDEVFKNRREEVYKI